MIFNGTEKEYLTVLRGRNRPAWAPIRRELITVPKMAGAHLSYSQVQVRQIDVPVFIMAGNFPDLQKLKEEMAEWLIHDEPRELIFKDEPDRIYYAVVDGGLNLDELVRWGDGVITFVCPDPYKYGQEKDLHFTEDSIIIENNGTATAKPIIELTARKKATFAMIANGDEQYNLIGQPADVDVQVVDSKELVLSERGEILNEWTTSGTDVDGAVTGQLTTDGTGIVVQSYGNASGWHGPALLKEINPVQDFEVEMRLRVKAENPNSTYRIEFYLFDENMDVLGKMAIMDSSQARVQYAAEGRIGNFKGKHAENYLISSRNYQRDRDHFHGLLRMRRISKRFEFYVSRIGHNEEGFLHHDTMTEVFNDVANEYQGRLKYVQIHIGKYGDSPSASTPRINAIEVYERSEITVDETPYIIYPGDVVTFDHDVGDVLLNGELSKDNFFGDFFELKKGQNHLVVSPEDTFDTVVKYRERYR